jgi:hypothetical protein
MPTVGRNEPCPCGSGKKYKQCHGPIDAEIAAGQRRIKQAPDTLLPKLMESLDRFATELPAALSLFWNNAYNVTEIKELDNHEDRGSERFLTWFAFDSRDREGRSPIQRLAHDPEGLELTDAEATVLTGWHDVRLQPYEVLAIHKGRGLDVRPLFGDTAISVTDHKASRRIQAGEVLVAHLIPAGDEWYVAGAAAQLTPDTVIKLREFADVHLADLQREQPDATHADLIAQRSYIFNHFVMALPREEAEAGKLDELVARTRATLNITAQQIGWQRSADRAHASDDVDSDHTREPDHYELVAASAPSYRGEDD